MRQLWGQAPIISGSAPMAGGKHLDGGGRRGGDLTLRPTESVGIDADCVSGRNCVGSRGQGIVEIPIVTDNGGVQPVRAARPLATIPGDDASACIIALNFDLDRADTILG